MPHTQPIQMIIVHEKVGLKHKLASILRWRKQESLQAKLHRYRATPSSQAA